MIQTPVKPAHELLFIISFLEKMKLKEKNIWEVSQVWGSATGGRARGAAALRDAKLSHDYVVGI